MLGWGPWWRGQFDEHNRGKAHLKAARMAGYARMMAERGGGGGRGPGVGSVGHQGAVSVGHQGVESVGHQGVGTGQGLRRGAAMGPGWGPAGFRNSNPIPST